MHRFGKLTGLGLVLVATVAVGAMAIAGCPAGGEPGDNEVFMRSISFDPAEITIQAGESVTWNNRDIVPHTAKSGNPGEQDLGSFFRSGNLLQGNTFTHTFNEVGEFVYFCEVHPVMMRNAKVIVEGPASP